MLQDLERLLAVQENASERVLELIASSLGTSVFVRDTLSISLGWVDSMNTLFSVACPFSDSPVDQLLVLDDANDQGSSKRELLVNSPNPEVKSTKQGMLLLFLSVRIQFLPLFLRLLGPLSSTQCPALSTTTITAIATASTTPKSRPEHETLNQANDNSHSNSSFSISVSSPAFAHSPNGSDLDDISFESRGIVLLAL